MGAVFRHVDYCSMNGIPRRKAFQEGHESDIHIGSRSSSRSTIGLWMTNKTVGCFGSKMDLLLCTERVNERITYRI